MWMRGSLILHPAGDHLEGLLENDGVKDRTST